MMMMTWQTCKLPSRHRSFQNTERVHKKAAAVAAVVVMTMMMRRRMVVVVERSPLWFFVFVFSVGIGFDTTAH
jgi:transposase InsO family protein